MLPMNKLVIPLVGIAVGCAPVVCYGAVTADTIRITDMSVSAPVSVKNPLMIDLTDVNGKRHDIHRVLKLNANRKIQTPSAYKTGTSLPLPADAESNALVRVESVFDISTFVSGVNLIVAGADKHIAYVDGKEVSGSFNLEPGTHKVTIDMLSTPESRPAPSVSLAASGISQKLKFNNSGKRYVKLSDFADGKRIVGVSLSPDGSMLQTFYTNTLPGGKTDSYYSITTTGQNRNTLIAERRDGARWMPKSNKLFIVRNSVDGRQLVSLDPATGAESVIISGLPTGGLTISPAEDFAIVTEVHEGPKEGDVYQILEPEDRQPGWRNRASLLKVNFADGLVEPLTFGNANTWLMDISDDGSKALIATRRSRLTKRPTTVTDIMSLNLSDMVTDTIVSADGFVSSAKFSPDGSKIVVAGTPEALGGIGRNLPDDRTPSMTETELFLVDAANPRKIEPLTKYFDPSVQDYQWSRADNRIYLTAEDRDYYHIYSVDPKSGSISQIEEPEDLVKGFSVPKSGSLMAWYGQGASNPDRLYLTDLRKNRMTLVEEPSADRLADVQLGECEAWSFDNGRGDTIYCRYFKPADFDPAKKYPLIVNYYGGCSPTSRNFESRYPHNLYAAQGYGVLVIVPSGATGRGQEFASRHVNTAGQGVAEDIIAGTKQFCAENPWVDASKIGCIGASYGGFMTQYLQTVTDIFAAAISHAGISDHTSYWGEGYWGYSYSEVSMANSYPWTHKDLYADQSPLFRAEKVNTPILFLHGDSDNNVPVGESIQMFTALKLLGKETAFVAVADQDHHILDYDKRIKWQNTIFAWFEKYLKNDSSWWDTLYTPKTL